jgi:hypothetical protein
VALADRRLVDQLTVDEFDPFVVTENTGFTHAVVVVRIQPVPRRQDRNILHAHLPSASSNIIMNAAALAATPPRAIG